MLQSRRRQSEQPEHEGTPGPSNDNDESLNRVLAELIGDGTVVLQDDDEDPDYQEGEDQDEEDEGEFVPDEMDEDDEEEEDMFGYQTVPTSQVKWHQEVKEPKEAGLSLLFSGEFGRIKHQIRSRHKDGDVSRLLLNRSTKARPSPREDLTCVSNP